MKKHSSHKGAALPYRERILAFLQRRADHPLTLQELAQALGASPASLRRPLGQLVQEGAVVRTRQGTYGPPEKLNLIIGRIERHRGGYAFLLPEQPGQNDLYLGPETLGSLWDGDRVVVRPELSEEGRPRGTVVRLLERATRQLVGTLTYTGELPFLAPAGEPRGLAPIPLLSDGLQGLAPGTLLLVEVTWPEERADQQPLPIGRLRSVLGPPDDPKAETLAAVYQFGLQPEFAPAALAQAQAIHQKIPGTALQGRQDLRNRLVFTIDDADAQDFDDAVSLEELGGGNWRLGVHIADVSYYVHPGSPLDLEARARGTSVYLPGYTLHMLPEQLSHGICSLLEGQDRLTASVFLDLNEKGKVLRSGIKESVIRSQARLTYDQVQALAEGGEFKGKPELAAMLRKLLEVSELLYHRRLAQGSLDLSLVERQVQLDGDQVEIVPVHRNAARGLIEECMLLANQAVADYLVQHHLPGIFRIHEEPDPQKLARLGEALASLGIVLRGGALSAGNLGEALAAVRQLPEAPVIQTLVLRSLKQARYSPENKGHFGLALESYLHFTSPIRRYPDLVVHRLLRASRSGDKQQVAQLQGQLGEIAAHSSLMERRAQEAEQDLTDYYQARWARQRLGEVYQGTISSVTPYGLYVELENGVQGLVHVSSLHDDYYTHDEHRQLLMGRSRGRRFQLGDQLSVQIAAATPQTRQIDFVLAADEKPAKGQRPRPATKPPARRPPSLTESLPPRRIYFGEWKPRRETPAEPAPAENEELLGPARRHKGD
ncbi:MAG: ribonuclease R [Deinococcus sp.]|nr:ribonuclease R [Deinococcus sp.]